MLSGIRQKVLQTYQQQKQRAQSENIQYDPISKVRDKKFLDKKIKKVRKTQFQKDKYKYADMKSRQLGKFKGGALMLTKSDLENIKKT